MESFVQRFDALVAQYPDEFKQIPVQLTARQTRTFAALREDVSKITNGKEALKRYHAIIDPIQVAFAKWCKDNDKVPLEECTLPPYVPPPPPVELPLDEETGCEIVDSVASVASIRAATKKLYAVDATDEPLVPGSTYRNALVFKKLYYFERLDGVFEMRRHFNWCPELQVEGRYKAGDERHTLEKAINEFDLHFECPPPVLISIDIETYTDGPPTGEKPKPKNPNSHIGVVCASVRRDDSIVDRRVFTWDRTGERELDPLKIQRGPKMYVGASEVEMIMELATFVRGFGERGEEVILTGWNISQQLFFEPFDDDDAKPYDDRNRKSFGYDIPWIEARAGAASVHQNAWPHGRACGGAITYSSLFGLHVGIVDMMTWTKMQFRAADGPENLKLDTVLAFLKLPLKQRHGMSYAMMNDIMANPHYNDGNPEHCFENIIRYCLYDCDAVLHIAQKLDYMPKLRCFMEVTGITLSAYISYTQAAWAMTFLARFAWMKREFVKLAWNYGGGGVKNGQYTGAVNWSVVEYVVEALCMMFDFTGLYASIMRAYRISPFSFIGTFASLAEVFADGRTPENTTYVRNPTEEEVAAANAATEGIFNALQLFREDTNTLNTYTAFAILEHDPFTETVEYFTDERTKHKKLLKEARARGDTDKVGYHNMMQLCFKTMANSLYGLLGTPFVCYVFNEKCAAAVAAAARDAILRASAIAGKRGRKLFIDTDSTAVELAPEYRPPLDFTTQAGVDAFNAWGKSMQETINAELKQSYTEAAMFPVSHQRFITFAFEAVFTHAYFAKRKTYYKMAIPADGVKVGVEPEFSFKGTQFSVQSALVRDRTLALLKRLIMIPQHLHAVCLAKFYTDELANIQANPLPYARKQT
ncbi:hypothetical protein PAPYR_11880 [Paratrimastix pyriformis]|uniref:DNA polymerase delta catalytic subunit n=1 Tax=Paratrimastix pyriformis TaxID=342808 RepID=A0ABQ8U2V6_9EUKA|nr:hypothetical protein PAPYR_11880 [Paratrimastix pyriformis]